MKIRNAYLKRVQPKNFDAALLEILCREGKLFVYLEPETNTDMFRREVLDYVHSIKDYATDLWQEEIDGLWQRILDNECLSDFLTIKKGVNTGHMNKYAVTTLVYMMQNNSVYKRDVPMLSLHLRLEGVTKKNKYYTSCCKYILTREEKAVFRGLLEK